MENLFDLAMLILLQAVLGFDNLLYISLESKRAPLESQKSVRIWGIGLAVVLRIVLLFVLLKMMASFQSSWFVIDTKWVHADVNFAAVITLLGGAFIIYTAIKEVVHMLSLEEEHAAKDRKPTSVVKIVILIVLMNLVFSFDSILSAMAITKVAWVMSVAIVISGILMIALADRVSSFLQKNRLYEVLGLFILFIVGVMLVSEGGHKAHLKFFGEYPVEQMSKTTFYFVIAVLVLVDVIQGRYQKKLFAEKARARPIPND